LRSGAAPSLLKFRHYYEEADPDRALAMLEDEMSDVVASTPTHAADRSAKGLDKLRTLLERECEAQACPCRRTTSCLCRQDKSVV
jgi:hypothetical protein